jgi:multisubunit Na+/H+ antiporter MnhG subunit
VVAIAVVSAEAFDARGIKAIIVFVVLAGLNPVLVHAIARAARSRASDVPR